MGISLARKQPANSGLKPAKFKGLLLIPALYIPGLVVFISYITLRHVNPGPAIFVPLFFLHLLSMFGLFYSIYFTAKALKGAELQRRVTFSDYVGEFFLLWFFPVGIWIIQPRINKLFDGADNQQLLPDSKIY